MVARRQVLGVFALLLLTTVLTGCVSGGGKGLGGFQPSDAVQTYKSISSNETLAVFTGPDGSLAAQLCSPDGSSYVSQTHWIEGGTDCFGVWIEFLSRKAVAIEIRVPQNRIRNATAALFPAGEFTVVKRDGIRRPVSYFPDAVSRVTFAPDTAQELLIPGNVAVLSMYAQRYLAIADASDYDARRIVLIVQDPHYDTVAQWSVFRGLSVFLAENVSLTRKAIFLTEGVPAEDTVDVHPLSDVFPDPDYDLIYQALDTYLISAQVAYVWKYGRLKVIGAEDKDLYQGSARLWTERRSREWPLSVVARNRKMAESAIAAADNDSIPILFLGGLHNERLPISRLADGMSSVRRQYDAGASDKLLDTRNEGVFDVLRENHVGYVFMVARMTDPLGRAKANEARYRMLFESQLSGKYTDYFDYLLDASGLNDGVTIQQAPDQAVKYLQEKKKRDKKKHRSGDAKRKEKKQVNQAGRSAGIRDANALGEFGDFVESVKAERGQGKSENLSFDELQELAREFAGFLGK